MRRLTCLQIDESNPHLKEETDPRSFLDAAKAILANPSGTGSLREAGLLLEAAIQVFWCGSPTHTGIDDGFIERATRGGRIRSVGIVG